jgi:hypothetical protein
MADRSRILDVPAPAPRPTLRAWLDREVAALYPGCFALVMATGIISSAFFREGRRGISDALFAANLAADRAGETAPVARRRFSAAAGDIARHGADRAAATALGLARVSWRSLRG